MSFAHVLGGYAPQNMFKLKTNQWKSWVWWVIHEPSIYVETDRWQYSETGTNSSPIQLFYTIFFFTKPAPAHWIWASVYHA